MNDTTPDPTPADAPGYFDILPSIAVCVAALSLLLVAHCNVA
jgi:hypothetical protein